MLLVVIIYCGFVNVVCLYRLSVLYCLLLLLLLISSLFRAFCCSLRSDLTFLFYIWSTTVLMYHALFEKCAHRHSHTAQTFRSACLNCRSIAPVQCVLFNFAPNAENKREREREIDRVFSQ